VLVLNCKLGGVRGLFCKVVDARGIPRRGPSPRGLASRGPRPRATARARHVAWATLAGRRACAVSCGPRGRFSFLFHKELAMVF